MKSILPLLLLSSSLLAGPLDRPGSGLQPSTGQTTLRVTGRVFQKLPDGIIVDCGTKGAKKTNQANDLVFIVNGPLANRLFAGDPVNCTAAQIGTYEYSAVGGHVAILRKLEAR